MDSTGLHLVNSFVWTHILEIERWADTPTKAEETQEAYNNREGKNLKSANNQLKKDNLQLERALDNVIAEKAQAATETDTEVLDLNLDGQSVRKQSGSKEELSWQNNIQSNGLRNGSPKFDWCIGLLNVQVYCDAYFF